MSRAGGGFGAIFDCTRPPLGRLEIVRIPGHKHAGPSSTSPQPPLHPRSRPSLSSTIPPLESSAVGVRGNAAWTLPLEHHVLLADSMIRSCPAPETWIRFRCPRRRPADASRPRNNYCVRCLQYLSIIHPTHARSHPTHRDP